MKVTRNEPPRPFAPITITLETQDEADELYAWSAAAVVSPSENPLGRLYKELRPFAHLGSKNRFFVELELRINLS